jgi:hypothetical protein
MVRQIGYVGGYTAGLQPTMVFSGRFWLWHPVQVDSGVARFLLGATFSGVREVDNAGMLMACLEA